MIVEYVLDARGSVAFSDETKGVDKEARPMSVFQEEDVITCTKFSHSHRVLNQQKVHPYPQYPLQHPMLF